MFSRKVQRQKYKTRINFTPYLIAAVFSLGKHKHFTIGHEDLGTAESVPANSSLCTFQLLYSASAQLFKRMQSTAVVNRKIIIQLLQGNKHDGP